jgi:hypothetical protein
MGFNEELYTMGLKPSVSKKGYNNFNTGDEIPTLALKPINNTITPELTAFKSNAGLMALKANEVFKDSFGIPDLTSTNTEDEEMKEKMTTKTKQIVVGSMVALALGVVIFIVIKNRK